MDSEQGVSVSKSTQQTGRSSGEGTSYTPASSFLAGWAVICVNILESDTEIGKIICRRHIWCGTVLTVIFFTCQLLSSFHFKLFCDNLVTFSTHTATHHFESKISQLSDKAKCCYHSMEIIRAHPFFQRTQLGKWEGKQQKLNFILALSLSLFYRVQWQPLTLL